MNFDHMLELVKVRRPTKRHTGKKWEAVFHDNGREIIRRFGQGKNELTGQQEAEDYTMHKSPERRYRYVKRHMKDLRGDPRMPGYLSMFLLWGESTSLKTQIAFYRRMLEEYDRTGTFPIASAERILKEGQAPIRHNKSECACEHTPVLGSFRQVLRCQRRCEVV